MDVRKSYTVKSGFKSVGLAIIYNGLDEAKAREVFAWEEDLLKNFNSPNTMVILYSRELEVSSPRTEVLAEFHMSTWEGDE